MLVVLLASPHLYLQRQAAKALANLAVNNSNKEMISKAGGVHPLVRLAGSKSAGVAVEAVAALANLAVNGELYNTNTTLTVSSCVIECYHQSYGMLPSILRNDTIY